MGDIRGGQSCGPFRHLIVDERIFVALVKEVVNNNDWSSLRMRLEILIVAKVGVIVVLLAV